MELCNEIGETHERPSGFPGVNFWETFSTYC